MRGFGLSTPFLLCALIIGCIGGEKPREVSSPTSVAQQPTAAPTQTPSPTAQLRKAFLTGPDVGRSWIPTRLSTPSQAISFFDPCTRQTRPAVHAVYQHLRKQIEKETTPEILQSIGRFETAEAGTFIQKLRAQCPIHVFEVLNAGDEAAILSSEGGLWERIVVVRRGDLIMVLHFLTFEDREQFVQSELDRLTNLAIDKFETLDP